MKKTYINPEMEIVELNMTQTLMAGSAVGTTVLDDPAGTDTPGLAPSLMPGMDFPIFGE